MVVSAPTTLVGSIVKVSPETMTTWVFFVVLSLIVLSFMTMAVGWIITVTGERVMVAERDSSMGWGLFGLFGLFGLEGLLGLFGLLGLLLGLLGLFGLLGLLGPGLLGSEPYDGVEMGEAAPSSVRDS